MAREYIFVIGFTIFASQFAIAPAERKEKREAYAIVYSAPRQSIVLAAPESVIFVVMRVNVQKVSG